MTDGSDRVLERIRAMPPGDITPAEYYMFGRALKGRADLTPVRLVFLSSFTTDLLDPFLVVEGARYGLAVDVLRGGFGQFEQAVLSHEWGSDDGAIEVLVAAMRLEDVDPDVAFRFYSEERTPFDSFAGEIIERLDATLSLFRSVSSGPALVANFAVPRPSPLLMFDANDSQSLTHKVHELNRTLAETVSRRGGQHVWDYAGLLASRGSEAWTDPRLWTLARMPVAAANQPLLANHLMRTVRAATFPPAKCLVVDLDDTLWGGAIGDDGLKGILLGDDHPGSTFKRFQRAILGLRDRGILLAVCSSNDESVALEALDQHPEMLVRRDDFAAMRINWRPKSENLREIAQELNIGIESLVFFDDNPVVRAEVRHRLPEIHVVEVPTDPALYVEALAGIAQLDAPALTSDDRLRARAVGAERLRTRDRQDAVSMEAFLASLDMRAELGAMDPLNAQRIAQLIAKTNQYNLTTRRHSQAELERMMATGAGEIHWLRLADRYGDMGLVCVGIIRVEGFEAMIDSLVLSCRVANRGVEQTMISRLATAARGAGASILLGQYLPTERNHVVAGLYPSLGFSEDVAGGEGKTYRLDLSRQDIRPPGYVRVTYAPVGKESHA